jgi:plastocyanin
MGATDRPSRGRAARLAGLMALSLVASLLLVALASPRAEVAAHPTQPIITIADFAFTPQVLVVTPGMAIRWVNRDRAGHTVTGVDNAAALKSPVLNIGESYEFTFNQPGVYRYVCSLHPNMTGEIRVLGEVRFPETGFTVRGPFLSFWETHGLEFGDPNVSYRESLGLFGYPISGEMQEQLEDGNTYTVQYFERARFEYHLESLQTDFGVQLGQFGRRLHPADPPVGAQPGAAYFNQTGHNVRGFLQYWQTNGGLSIFGFPLSEEFTETLENGNPYTVQYFERVRLEYHPEAQSPYDVQLGQFGRRILEGR